MRRISGLCCALLMVCSSTFAAGWPCDICMCPQVMIWYDIETDDSLWLCDKHTCEVGCDCGTVTEQVFRYYSGFQDVGICTQECDIYCEQIFTGGLGTDPTPDAAPAVPEKLAAADAVEAERDTKVERRPSPRPGAVRRRSHRLEQTGDAGKPALDVLQIKINGADGWNKSIKTGEVVAGSTCYIEVERAIGNKTKLKLFTINFTAEIEREGRPTTTVTIPVLMGFEVPPAQHEPVCTDAVTKIEQVKASQETELNNSANPVHFIDGFYQVTVGGNVYHVRTKHDLKEIGG